MNNYFANDHIIWVDTETTGINPKEDMLLEVACFVTDMQGNQVSEDMEVMIKHPDFNKDSLDAGIIEFHQRSGLWEAMEVNPGIPMSEADKALTEFIKPYAEKGNIYMGGNSIAFDRSFLVENMPEFYKNIHYRSIDVTTLWMALTANFDVPGKAKKMQHRAMSDIKESRDEYVRYIEWMKEGRK